MRDASSLDDDAVLSWRSGAAWSFFLCYCVGELFLLCKTVVWSLSGICHGNEFSFGI